MKISLVSPSFNQARFLERMIASVVCQKGVEYEHIVFDGDSTDGSKELLLAYGERPCVHVTIEPDRGQAHAINKGFAASSCEILGWLNSDDYYEDENVFAHIVEFFQDNPDIDVVYGRGRRVDGDGNILSEAFIQAPGTDFSLALQHSLGLLQPAVFFRRKVYEKVGGLSEVYNLQLDYEFWIRIARAGFRFGFLDRFLARAVVHEDAKSTAQRQQQLNECLHLVNENFNYVPVQWLDRYAEFFVSGLDRKVHKVQLNEAQQEDQRFIRQVLLEHYDSSERVSALLAEHSGLTLYKETLAAVAEVRSRRRQVVITSFDSKYFKQGLNLIASLHRTSFICIDAILVYSLELSSFERAQLEAIEKVSVIDYDAEAKDYFHDYLDPKTRAYKPFAIRSGEPWIQQADLVLWMDAGLSALQSIQEVFDQIEMNGFFITDHDDRPGWPFPNIHFTHRDSLSALGISNTELLAPHLCSCIIGYERGGKFQHIIDEAFEIGKTREAVVWSKLEQKSDQYIPQLDTVSRSLKESILAGTTASSEISRDQLVALFPYYGHRTQTIYSMLASRYGVPYSSARRFHKSNDASAAAARTNWKDTAHDTDKSSSRMNLAGVDENVVIYHHRGVFNDLSGTRYKRNGDHLFVVGNGPSLKGFDFDALNNVAWLGMNAAYRFWDRTGNYPTYYCCFDEVVLESHKVEILKLINSPELGIEKFFLREVFYSWYPELVDNPLVLTLERMREDVDLLGKDKITTGSYAVKVGVWLGFRHIYLLGIDLNYVEKIEEASLKGRILEVEKDPEHNPNYFFDDYQRKGDRYNPPNRHADMHLRSWTQVAEILKDFPVEIVNLNRDSAVRDFPFDDSDRVIRSLSDEFRGIQWLVDHTLRLRDEAACWRARVLTDVKKCRDYLLSEAAEGILPLYPRSAHAHIDETKVVAKLLPGRQDETRVMFDVGAHVGGSASHFVGNNWRVLCFEPDRNNRKQLVKRFGNHTDVTIDPRAVGEQPSSSQPFFTSPESKGISGLSAFHDTHTQSDAVEVTTVAAVLQQQAISRIDFLKIDVEGLDLAVLRGVPWDRVKPAVVECEFEDAKTVPLGHTWRDIADFLVGHGYIVYISEWHPIIRYGIRHDWCGLRSYPCELADETAWGNILAFQVDPGIELMRWAARNCVVLRSKAQDNHEVKSVPSTATTPLESKEDVAHTDRQSMESRELILESESGPDHSSLNGVYGNIAAGVRTRSLMVFRIAQFTVWAIRALLRHPVATGIGVALVALALVLPLYTPTFFPYRTHMGIAALAVTLVLIAAGVFSALYQVLERVLLAQRASSAALVGQLRNEVNARISSIESTGGELSRRVNQLAKLTTTLGAGVARDSAQIKKLFAEQQRQHDAIQKQEDLVSTNRRRIEQLESDLSKGLESLDNSAAIMGEELRRQHDAIQKQEDLVSTNRRRIEQLESDLSKGLESLDNSAATMGEELQRQRDAIQKQEDLVSTNRRRIEQLESDLNKGLDSLNNSAAIMGEELRSEMNESTTKQLAKVKVLEIWKSAAEQRLAKHNAVIEQDVLFQHFSRSTSPALLDKLCDTWGPRLGLPMTRPAISYMAHRIRVVEQTCTGRLATQIEDATLRTLVSAAVPGKSLEVLEIGTLFGIGLVMIYDYNRDRYESVHVTAIDPLDGYYERKAPDVLLNIPITSNTFWHNVDMMGVPRDHVTLIPALSTQGEALRQAAQRQYDLLVIDSDHSYAGVKADFDGYAGMVKPGGYIIFDDYGSKSWPAVKAYVDAEIMNRTDLVFVGAEWRTAVFRVTETVGG